MRRKPHPEFIYLEKGDMKAVRNPNDLLDKWKQKIIAGKYKLVEVVEITKTQPKIRKIK